jgi:hypothetical protein
MKYISILFTGIVGIVSAQVASIIPISFDFSEFIKIITQLVILFATIFALFNKKKTHTNRFNPKTKTYTNRFNPKKKTHTNRFNPKKPLL